MAFLPRHVFSDRWERIRGFLDETGCQAMVVLSPENFYLVTGFLLDVAPWERPVAAVIPLRGEPFCIMNELSRNHLRLARERGTMHVEDVLVYSERPSPCPTAETIARWPELLADKLRQRGITSGRVAVEDQPRVLKKVRKELPGLRFRDGSRFLRQMRMVKYPEELDILRQCAPLTDWAQDQYLQAIRPGMVMAEVDFEVARRAAVEGARRFPQDHLQITVFSLRGPDTAAPHGTGAGAAATVRPGDVVVNNIVFRLNGLVVENERTLFVGDPRTGATSNGRPDTITAEQANLAVRAFEAATEANLAALEKYVAGEEVAAAHAAAEHVFHRLGFSEYVIHRTGHGVGIAGHEYPEDMAFCRRPFQEREVFSCEPGVYIYGLGGFRHDDTVIVGSRGPEVLTTRSKKLEDQIVPV